MIPRRPGPSVRVRVAEYVEGQALRHEDRVATEEPLEIRLVAPGLVSTRLGVTMRTPGHDFELAAGWLTHERIASPEAILGVRYCTDADLSELEEFNVVTVELTSPPLRLPGARSVSSACGVCGSDTIGELLDGLSPAAPVSLSVATISVLPEGLRAAQATFERTGGLHAAGLFTAVGERIVVREDIGRHNAVDKAVGACLLGARQVPPVLVLSGRIGVELVQKAAVSGIGAIVAVGAPSSLAVDLAERAGVLLVGFTRDERFVVYSGDDRIGV